MAAHQGSPVPGILQARTLEWVAISFSNAWKWKGSRSVVSDSSRPHELQPTRFLHPWDFPGKNTGVGCHRLLRPGKGTKRRANRVCDFVEYLNLSGLDLISAHNPGPTLDSSPAEHLEPEQCRLGKHTCYEWGQTQCDQITASTRQW